MTLFEELTKAVAEVIHKALWQCDHTLPDEANCIWTARKAVAAVLRALPENWEAVANDVCTCLPTQMAPKARGRHHYTCPAQYTVNNLAAIANVGRR